MSQLQQLREAGIGSLGNMIDMATSKLGDIEDKADKLRGDINGNINDAKSIKRNNQSYTSIMKAGADLVMTFPVLCTRSIDIDPAIMVTKAIERKCTSMLQMLLTAANLTGVVDGAEYLKKFHSNIKLNGPNVDEAIYYMGKLLESGNPTIQNNSASMYCYEKDIPVELANEMMRYLRDDTFVLEQSTGDHPISEFAITKNGIIRMSVVVQEADDDAAKRVGDMFKSQTEILTKQLLDNDVKKANELVPSLIIVRFTSIVNGTQSVPTTFIAGVKAKLIPCDSSELIDRIIMKNTDRRGLLKLIRATTGEISFIRDFVLSIDKAKIDVLAKQKKGSRAKMWKVLENRADAAKKNLKKGISNADAAMITTMVLSSQEVELLAKHHNINMADEKTARGIMESYNLMCLVIIDEAVEVAKFLFDDGEGTFEDMSFNALERESGDGQYKKIVNLMSKIH